MKKYIIGGVLAVAIVAYVVFLNNKKPSAIVVSDANTSTGTGAIAGTTTNPGTAAAGSGTTAPAGRYKDGTYAGSVADAFYGNLQAAVTVIGGRIAKISFTQYPTGGHSGEVSSYSLPILAQEAIAAQSANVNAVSGATQTSDAFVQTVGSALAQAKA